MKLYSSGLYQKAYTASYPIEHNINTVQSFKKVVCCEDYAFAAFRDGYTSSGRFVRAHRASEDWLSSDVLYADFDDGYTIEEFAKVFANYEWYLTTSKSHQKKKNDVQCDRFHVVFPIHEVKDIAQHKAYLRLLHQYFFRFKHLDRACIDSCRFFYAYKDSIVLHNEGKSIGIIIHKLWLKVPKPQPKPTPNIPRSYHRLILHGLNKAHKLGWFDDYYSWLNLGMALHRSGFDVSDWQRFCNTQNDEKQAVYKWKGFSATGTIDINYLLNICKRLV